MISSLVKIFYKIANNVELSEEDSNLMEYLSTFDTTPDKSVSKWVIKHLDNHELPELEGLVKTYLEESNNLAKIDNYSVDGLKEELGIGEGFESTNDPRLIETEDDDSEISSRSYFSNPRFPRAILDLALYMTGATEIIRGGGSSFIARGAYGDVHEVEFNGKRRAMKISTAKEADTYEKVKDKLDSIPDKHRKNFLYIDDIEAFSYDGAQFGAVIMEILEPLPKGIKLQGWKYASSYQDVTDGIKEYYTTILRNINQAIFDQIFETVDIGNIKLGIIRNLESYHDLFDVNTMLESTQLESDDDYDFVPREDIFKMVDDYIKDQLFNIMNEFYMFIGEKKEFELITTLSFAQDILDRAALNLNLSYDRLGIPRDSGDLMAGDIDEDVVLEDLKDERLADLFLSLKYVKDNGIFSFQDVHAENVMHRPSDDSFVVVDFGLFDTGDQTLRPS